MPQICVRFPDRFYNDIEERAKNQNSTKPRIVESIVRKQLMRESMGEPPESVTVSEQVKSMKERVAMLQQQLRDKDVELTYLRQEYSKLNEVMVQRLLKD